MLKVDIGQRYINGFPCDIPLPDPDIYINEVNIRIGQWNITGKAINRLLSLLNTLFML